MNLNTISLPWVGKANKRALALDKGEHPFGATFLCLSQAHVRKLAPDSRGTCNCWSTINFWTAGPGTGFRSFFVCCDISPLGEKRKGRGERGAAAAFTKDFFGDKMAQSCHVSWRKKRKLNLPCLDHRFLHAASSIGVWKELYFFLWPLSSQIWLSPLVDDHQSTHLTTLNPDWVGDWFWLVWVCK